VGDERPQRDVAVQRQQAADAGVLGVVLLAGRATAPRDQVGVDRQHGEPGVDQLLDQHTVAGLQHHPDLGRVRFQGGDAFQQRGDRTRGVLDACHLGHAVARPAQRDQVVVLGPVDPNGKHQASFPRPTGRRHGAVLMDQSSRDDTLMGVGPPGPAPWDAVSRQSSRDKPRKHSQGATP
jgi:hypothetical protein